MSEGSAGSQGLGAFIDCDDHTESERERQDMPSTPRSLRGKIVYRAVMLVAYGVDIDDAFEQAVSEYTASDRWATPSDDQVAELEEITHEIVAAAESKSGFNEELSTFT